MSVTLSGTGGHLAQCVLQPCVASVRITFSCVALSRRVQSGRGNLVACIRRRRPPDWDGGLSVMHGNR